MKNGGISNQLNMQEQQIAIEKENMHVGISANRQDEWTENKFVNKQDDNLSNNTTNKQYFNISDLRLSSALGLLNPEPNNNEDEEILMKRKKKKPKRGFRK